MKYQKWIILLVITLIVILLSFFLIPKNTIPSSKTKHPSKRISTFTVRLKSEHINLNLAVKKSVSTEKSVAFPISGILETGELTLKVGTSFKRGQLLFQLNNQAAFKQLVQTKKNIANQVQTFLQQNTWLDAKSKADWENFAKALAPNTLLIPFPKTNAIPESSRSEMDALKQAYSSALQAENAMRNFFLLAPTDGVITSIHVQIGRKVNANQVLLKYSQTNRIELEVEIDTNTYHSIRSVNRVAFVADKYQIPVNWLTKQVTFKQGFACLKWVVKCPKSGNNLDALLFELRGETYKDYAVIPKDYVQTDSVCIEFKSLHKIPVSVCEKGKDSLLVLGLKSVQKIQKKTN
jgi:multidrug efflux pump subunit AcrA (membrane-fusion protein)